EATALPLPTKPSIAVLPFTHLSQDPEQEYFSDGITEDLITTLSRMSGLFVIARHSTFSYKGKAVKTAEVSRELGVRYVLDGSVRKSDGRVRITVRLVDGLSGYHLGEIASTGSAGDSLPGKWRSHTRASHLSL